MKTLKLCLHKGASAVSRDELENSFTPEPTETWYPISHAKLLHQVETHLENSGMKITGETHAIGENGNRYFGLLSIESPDNSIKDYSMVMGLRNSHDKTFPASLCLGSQVFVCDNLAFSGEVKFGRRHTINIARDLPGIVSRAVGKLASRWLSLAERIDAYKNREISNNDMHDLVIRMLDSHAINCTDVPKILKEFRAPSHPEFAEARNVWRLMNATTEIKKGSNIFGYAAQTESMHGVLDTYCGIATAEVPEMIEVGNN